MQKLNIGEALSAGFKLSKTNFSKLFFIFLFIYLFLDIGIYVSDFDTPSTIGLIIVLWTIYLYKEYKARTKAVSQANQNTDKLLWPVLFTNIIQGLFLIGLLLLFIIPAIIFGVYWIFSTFVVMDKGVSGPKALSLSKSMIKGNWWKMFIISVLIFLPAFIAMIPVLYFDGIIPVIVTSILQTVAIYYSINVLLACYLRLSVNLTLSSPVPVPLPPAVPASSNIETV